MKDIGEKKSSTCLPVFSVENCINLSAAKGESFGFSTFIINARSEHGVFEFPSGIFTAETTGTYQLTLSALVYLSPGSQKHRFDLKVSEETVAFSHNDSTSKGYQSAVLSTLLPPALVESKLQLFRHSHIHPQQSYILKNNDRCYYCVNLLSSYANLKKQEEDVCVMPNEEMQLVTNPDSLLKLIQLANNPLFDDSTRT